MCCCSGRHLQLLDWLIYSEKYLFRVFTEIIPESFVASQFFWVVVLETTFGLIASFTRPHSLEGIGASKFGTVFIFLLETVIGIVIAILNLAEAPALCDRADLDAVPLGLVADRCAYYLCADLLPCSRQQG